MIILGHKVFVIRDPSRIENLELEASWAKKSKNARTRLVVIETGKAIPKIPQFLDKLKERKSVEAKIWVTCQQFNSECWIR